MTQYNKEGLLKAAGVDVTKVDYALPQHLVNELDSMGIPDVPRHFVYTYEHGRILGGLYPISEAMWTIFDHIDKSNDEVIQQIAIEDDSPYKTALIEFLCNLPEEITKLPIDFNVLIQAFRAGHEAPPRIPTPDEIDIARSSGHAAPGKENQEPG